jgi:N-acetylmuramic acid 6-phosphate etherase
MKAGTAQKMILNMLSTGAMARLGYVFGNHMVHVHTKNEKLLERGLGILRSITGATRTVAMHNLRAAGGSVPVALIAMRAEVTAAEATRLLSRAGGNVRRALQLASAAKK